MYFIEIHSLKTIKTNIWLGVNLMKYEGYEILCKLKKSNIPLTSKVNLNEFTKSLENTFDYDFDGISKFYPFEFPEQLKNKDYNIIVITGKSGSGKSTFMNYYGSEEKIRMR